jgi:hypothetical protein
MTQEMSPMLSTLFKFAGGAAAGAVLGAVIGILTTPFSGADFKRNVQAFKEDVILSGKEAEMARRRELEQRFSEAKRFKPTSE